MDLRQCRLSIYRRSVTFFLTDALWHVRDVVNKLHYEIDVATIQATHIRYIKLGSNGSWARRAFEEGKVYFGAKGIDHEACIDGNWPLVSKQLETTTKSKQGQTEGLRQIKAFYNTEKTLWITMSDGHV